MKTVTSQNLTIINHNGNYYRVIFAFITKKDAYNLIKNAVILILTPWAKFSSPNLVERSSPHWI